LGHRAFAGGVGGRDLVAEARVLARDVDDLARFACHQGAFVAAGNGGNAASQTNIARFGMKKRRPQCMTMTLPCSPLLAIVETAQLKEWRFP